MNSTTSVTALRKAYGAAPALRPGGPTGLVIVPGTTFGAYDFDEETPVELGEHMTPGTDYLVVVGKQTAKAVLWPAIDRMAEPPDDALGGFHYAPGGNATARKGGSTEPAVNPRSLWDLTFRPACPDPRGMTFVDGALGGRFWCDIYLCGADHLNAGTSRFGAMIADGNSPPQAADGSRYGKFDYAAAAEVMAHHGKGLLSVIEFFDAAFGVTERTAIDRDPVTTKLDAPRTSKWGLMQATGNLWAWTHDGDPDTPRASLSGGSWWGGGSAGSRRAYVAYGWPGDSGGSCGARGRCDHLQPV